MYKFSFQIRSVQLDLARQMETPEFIKGFIDFIAGNGYNSLTLYLEGRIRTASFPFPPDSECYTPQQMKEIICYAQTRGIEVIPVIPALGHAELFFKYAQIEGLSETRGEFKGRFGSNFKHVYCPSLPETYQFLESYFSEIAEIFPSPYFHVGCDESWDIGCCDLCRNRLNQGETQADLFTKHLGELHRIVTGKLNKRMIIWDDMFEYYPEALEALPRDIILACWQYQENVEKTEGHFVNRVMTDSLAIYDRLGFEYLICPADYTLHNAESFTAYAAKHKPLGGLMTVWEKSRALMLKSMPIIACVGRLWQSGVVSDDDRILKSVVKDIMGINDDVFFQAIKSFCSCGFYPERQAHPDIFFTRRENDFNYSRIRLVDMLLAVLPDYLDQVKKSSRDILEEIILTLRVEQIDHEFCKLLPQFFKSNADIIELTKKMTEIVRRLESVGNTHAEMWHRIRSGIVPCKITEFYENYVKKVQEIPALAARSGFLKVHFLLPDQYSAQTVQIFIRYDDTSTWEKITQGVFKELVSLDCFYSRIFPIARDKMPVGLKIETWGFGGQGFTYFEVENDRGRFVPAAIDMVIGTVTDPEHLLDPDWKWAFAGEKNTLKAFQTPELSNAVHGFELKLKKMDENL